MTGLQGEDRHAELLGLVGRIDAPERQKRLLRESERVPQRSEVLLDELRREPIVPGRHRRVRGEDDLRRHAAHRFVRADALDIHPPPHQLERRKGAVSLVQMHDAGRDVERGQRAHAADAEQQLLADPDALIAAVEPGGQLAVLGAVAVDVRVEQQERVASDGDPPDARDDPARPRLDLHRHRHAVVRRRLDRQQPVVDVDVLLALPGVVIEPLPEVALVVVEADADERDPEVGGALEMVAGEDAEPARVDRNRLVQAELRREVRHRPGAEDAGVPRAPRVLRRQVFLQPPVGLVDAAVKRELRRAQLELIDRDALQQRQRIVIARAPHDRVQIAEQAGALVVPAPPQVPGDRGQPLVDRRHELADRARLADDRRQLCAGGGQHAARHRRRTRALRAVCTTSTPCSTPRSIKGTPRNVR